MASDRELEAWMGSKGISRQNLSADNLMAAQNLAKNLGIKGSGKNGEFTQEDADIWGMSQGFVPNFVFTPPIQTTEDYELKTGKSSKPFAAYLALVKAWNASGENFRPLNEQAPGFDQTSYKKANAFN